MRLCPLTRRKAEKLASSLGDSTADICLEDLPAALCPNRSLTPSVSILNPRFSNVALKSFAEKQTFL